MTKYILSLMLLALFCNPALARYTNDTYFVCNSRADANIMFRAADTDNVPLWMSQINMGKCTIISTGTKYDIIERHYDADKLRIYPKHGNDFDAWGKVR